MNIKVKDDADSANAGKWGTVVKIDFVQEVVILEFISKMGNFIRFQYLFNEVENYEAEVE